MFFLVGSRIKLFIWIQSRIIMIGVAFQAGVFLFTWLPRHWTVRGLEKKSGVASGRAV